MSGTTARWRVHAQFHQPSPSGPCHALPWVPWTCSDPQVLSNTTFSSHGKDPPVPALMFRAWRDVGSTTCEIWDKNCWVPQPSPCHQLSCLIYWGVKHNFYAFWGGFGFLTNVPIEALLLFDTSLAKSTSNWALPFLIPTLHIRPVFLYSSQDTWILPDSTMHFLLVLHFHQKVLTWSLLSCSYGFT